MLFASACSHPAGEPAQPRVREPKPFTRAAGAAPYMPAEQSVVVMVFDGLAPALVAAAHTPVLDRIAREGSSTTEMVPPFPSISLFMALVSAWGAGIASGKDAGRVRAIDLHPTVAHLLGIAPGQPVDGRVAYSLLDPSG